MSLVVSVLYKRTPELIFKMDYYLSRHIPLVKKHWGPHGLASVKVFQTEGEAEFACGVIMFWKDAAGWDAAQKDQGTNKIMADVPNFSNGTPNFVVGKVVE